MSPAVCALSGGQKQCWGPTAPARLSARTTAPARGSLKSWANPFFNRSPPCPKKSESKPISAPPSLYRQKASPPLQATAKKSALSAVHPPAAKRTLASVLKRAVNPVFLCQAATTGLPAQKSKSAFKALFLCLKKAFRQNLRVLYAIKIVVLPSPALTACHRQSLQV